ncbi:MAG TPA: HgcAB-associated protein [Methanoregulaceae archaeon]|nr:HgcAB-associated protein [Methanoregulaceae archaeon]HOV67896.1 HgcAB-associated protein [Methanoregulaceae archaeon]HQJ87849.1 HgcAB-associated protein [Methanoregulaceae archaeon]
MTDGQNTCRLETLVKMDERGQIVLPKELRRRFGVEPGGRIAICSCECNGEVSCLVLMRANRLDPMVHGLLGPVMHEVV